MPTREEWTRVYAELAAKLKFPCKLKLSDSVKVAHHITPTLFGHCYIEINPNSNFRVPEHLILHEAAHHRAIDKDLGCCYGHCKHWAQELCKMYKETGIALPRSTGFEEFARAAGIVCKVFNPNEDKQLIAIADNPGLVEGA